MSAEGNLALAAEVESLRTQLAEVTRERDEAQWELDRWRSGARRKGLVTVEAVPDAVHYAAELIRAQGTEGGEDHDRLLAAAGQRLKAISDAASHLLAEAVVNRARLSSALKVVEAAKAFAIAARSPEHQRFYRSPWAEMADILAAVDTYQQQEPTTPSPVETVEVGDQVLTIEVEGE